MGTSRSGRLLPETTAARQNAFLEALRLTGVIRHAARAAQVSHRQTQEWRKNDPNFLAAFEEAIEEATDRLEAEAVRRAHDGVEEYVVSAGKLVRDDEGRPLVQLRYSDTLLVALLKARRPERFNRPADARLSVEGEGAAVTFTLKIDGPAPADGDATS